MEDFKNVDYIITAKHYGEGSARKYILKSQRDLYRRGIAVRIKGLDDKAHGAPVYARIWQGQWIAECECKGASFVDPDEPIFFCFSCANRRNGSAPRPVIFPPEQERREIERLILERPVDDLAGLTDLERAGMAKPVVFIEKKYMDGGEERVTVLPLTRSWNPGESVDDLREQQEGPLKKYHHEKKRGGNGIR